MANPVQYSTNGGQAADAHDIARLPKGIASSETADIMLGTPPQVFFTEALNGDDPGASDLQNLQSEFFSEYAGGVC